MFMLIFALIAIPMFLLLNHNDKLESEEKLQTRMEVQRLKEEIDFMKRDRRYH